MTRLIVFLVTLYLVHESAAKNTVTPSTEKIGTILQAVMECIGKTGVSTEVLFKFRSGQSVGDDANFKKFIHCIFITAGYSDKNGKIDVDKAIEVFPKSDQEVVKKVMDECNKAEGSDPVEVTYKFAKCFHKTSPVKLSI